MKTALMNLRPVLAWALSAIPAQALVVNLNTWTAESYPAVSGFGAGVWTVSGPGDSVLQSVNGQPTIFYSDFQAQGTTVSGKIRPGADGDDDFVGFVLGYNPGDVSNAAANYLLIDWKQGTQNFNFGAPSSSPGGDAVRGLAVSRVTGIPDADEFWQHLNLSGTPAGSGLAELARGNTLGSTGWVDNTEYTFKFEFGPSNLRVYVDNALEIDLAGTFGNGRMGFYNFSQSSVTYSAFEVDQGPFPTPDRASSLLLIAAGVLGAAGLRRTLDRTL